MGQFGSGTMEDPLRHAMGMRSAQDKYKMQLWNSLPQIFQNTIFHGEQEPKIKDLRHNGTMAERIEYARSLKDAGNVLLKSANPKAEVSQTPAITDVELLTRLNGQINDVQSKILEKEQQLKNLRQQLKNLKTQLDQASGKVENVVLRQEPELDKFGRTKTQQCLEDAITAYEKAAGIFRYVECTRPDWKNDDGSYKGIEDEWLVVDTSSLEGSDVETNEAKELVASCYLNIALASQKLDKFDQMKTACDEVINKVNPDCVKALYRRAQARTLPISALDSDRDIAIQDLVHAVKIAPQDKDVRALLEKLRMERKVKESNERNTFAGLFDRGNVVTNDPRREGEPEWKFDPSKMDLRDPAVQRYLDIRPGPNCFKD